MKSRNVVNDISINNEASFFLYFIALLTGSVLTLSFCYSFYKHQSEKEWETYDGALILQIFCMCFSFIIPSI